MIPIRDTAPCYSKPVVTWLLIVSCTVIFIVMQFLPDQMVFDWLHRYGMVGARYSHPEWAANYGMPFDGYLSFVTNLFLHGNWGHLLVNIWFLWIFADNIEDRMGRLPFLLFYLLCGVFATILQWYFGPELTIPVVGASGAIAGVLGAYFFIYPFERVVIWVPVLFYPVIIHVPAIAFLGIWVIIQLHDATTAALYQEGAAAHVAWWAHLGGFIAGAILYRFFVKPLREQEE